MTTSKQILLTGVSSGIGFKLSEHLIAQGYRVVGIARDATKISHLLGDKNFKFISFDLINTIDIEEMFRNNIGDIKFDGFVHCAGFEETLPLKLQTVEAIKNIFSVNVFAGIELMRLISQRKSSNDGASMVFIGSVMSELGQAGKIGYCSSKSAILGIVRSAALELSKRKIRVNAVSPGIVRTSMTDRLFGLLDEKKVEEIVNMHPLGIGNVSDVIPLINFLLSNESRWITGQNLIIDGGYSIY